MGDLLSGPDPLAENLEPRVRDFAHRLVQSILPIKEITGFGESREAEYQAERDTLLEGFLNLGKRGLADLQDRRLALARRMQTYEEANNGFYKYFDDTDKGFRDEVILHPGGRVERKKRDEGDNTSGAYTFTIEDRREGAPTTLNFQNFHPHRSRKELSAYSLLDLIRYNILIHEDPKGLVEMGHQGVRDRVNSEYAALEEKMDEDFLALFETKRLYYPDEFELQLYKDGTLYYEEIDGREYLYYVLPNWWGDNELLQWRYDAPENSYKIDLITVAELAGKDESKRLKDRLKLVADVGDPNFQTANRTRDLAKDYQQIEEDKIRAADFDVKKRLNELWAEASTLLGENLKSQPEKPTQKSLFPIITTMALLLIAVTLSVGAYEGLISISFGFDEWFSSLHRTQSLAHMGGLASSWVVGKDEDPYNKEQPTNSSIPKTSSPYRANSPVRFLKDLSAETLAEAVVDLAVSLALKTDLKSQALQKLVPQQFQNDISSLDGATQTEVSLFTSNLMQDYILSPNIETRKTFLSVLDRELNIRTTSLTKRKARLVIKKLAELGLANTSPLQTTNSARNRTPYIVASSKHDAPKIERYMAEFDKPHLRPLVVVINKDELSFFQALKDETGFSGQVVYEINLLDEQGVLQLDMLLEDRREVANTYLVLSRPLPINTTGINLSDLRWTLLDQILSDLPDVNWNGFQLEFLDIIARHLSQQA
ncbi:hypothetical protein BVX98_07520 [bacterium F11]|nr:hypothetical protein BVX98_07520 [bacterium F11]